jgi:nucleoside-diphosphate-sugar epimerase
MPTEPTEIKPDARILVTGATGFVGGHVAAHLLEAGRPLRLLVRPSSDLERLPKPLRRALDDDDERVELFEGDLTDAASLAGIFDDETGEIAGLIHCACAVKGTFDESRTSREIFHKVNVDGARNLAEKAADAGARMVHLSSTAAMGPVRDALVDETTECVPAAPYQRSKRQAELALLGLRQTRKLDVVILRPCLILGPGKDGGEPLKLFKLARRGVFPKIGGSMAQTKPLIDVRDVARACQSALNRGRAGEIYLIHSDAGHTLGEILEVTRRLVGARRGGLPLPEGPVRAAAHGFEALGRIAHGFNPPLTPARLDLFLTDRRISVAKARRELGFEPQCQDLYDMLGRTYVGYVRDGQLNP